MNTNASVEVASLDDKEIADNQPVKIKSVDEFIKVRADQIDKENKSVTNYLFRGLPNSDWSIKSTALIRMEKGLQEDAQGKIIPRQDEMLYNQALIEHFKHESLKNKDSPILDTDLGILAQLRHYNCAASLIDFTGNPLVALWFACQTQKDTDGIVHTLAIENTDDFIEIYSLEQLEYYTIEKIFSEDNKDSWFYWKPSHLNRRIPAQSSYFVIGKKNINEKVIRSHKIIISGEYKQKILNDLFKNYNIDYLSLFPDMAGFAQGNSNNSPYGISEKARREIRFYTTQILKIEEEDKKGKQESSTQLGVLLYQRGMAKEKLDYMDESDKDISSSMEKLNKSIEDSADDFDAFYYRGVIHSIRDRHEDAIMDFNQAIRINDKSFDAYIYKGFAENETRKFDAAILSFDKAIEQNPEYDGVYNNRGFAKLELNRNEEAIKDFNIAININPESFRAHSNRGTAYASMGGEANLREAINNYNRAIELNSKSSSYYISRGCVKIKMKNFSDSIKDFEIAISLDEDGYEAYYYKGIANKLLGNFDAALEDLNRSISVNNSHFAPYLTRGKINIKLKLFEDAIKDFNSASKLSKNNGQIHYKRGRANLYQGSPLPAIKDFEKAVKIDEKNYRALSYRGLAKACMDQYDKGLADCTDAINICPDYAPSHYNLGEVYLRTEYYTKARKKFIRSIESDENHYDAYIGLGIINIKHNKLTEANDNFNQAIEIDSEGAQSYFARWRSQLEPAKNKKNKKGESITEYVNKAKKMLADLEKQHKSSAEIKPPQPV